MKRLSAITAALLTIATATPVQAGEKKELDYALAYEADVTSLLEVARDNNMTGEVELTRLQSRLQSDRDATFNTAGMVKMAMCKLGNEPMANRFHNSRIKYYASLPKTAVNQLDYRADMYMIVLLAKLPCD